MTLRSLSLLRVRNHQDYHVELSPGVNWVLGPNGSGKTTILESVHVLISGRSFRTPHLRHMIQTGASDFHIAASMSSSEVDEELTFSYDGSVRHICHNGNALKKVSDLVGILPGITLTPHDIQLIDGPPAYRRYFLDLYLSQQSPLYLFQLSRYHRALEQRNAALRQQASQMLLEPFEQVMCESSQIVHAARTEAVAHLQHRLFAEELDIVFHSNMFIPQYTKERELGWTLSGPHKEDFTILLQRQPAKNFASEGQKRSAVIAIRLAQFDQLRRYVHVPPILLIDEPGLGFDSQRFAVLLDEIAQFPQVILSSATRPLQIDPNHIIVLGPAECYHHA